MKKGILIKYGEIVLKGNNRAQFENVLIKDIRMTLRSMGELNISKEQGRLFIEAPDLADFDLNVWMERMIDGLTKVFGIIGICPVDVLEDNDPDTICQAMVSYIKREFPVGQPFKVFVKRADKKYPLDSMQLAALVGEKVLESDPSWTVDVHHPKVKLFVELRSRVYVYGKEVPGVGGLPVGTGGKATHRF